MRSLAAALIMVLAGCSGDETETGPIVPPDAACAAGELALDGSCVAAGVPPDVPQAGINACAAGFEPTGDMACNAVLPAAPCPSGMMAVPGERDCRPIAPCGTAPWGSIPIEGNTEHVDASYTLGDSDGTALKPWSTIQQGIAAAAPGAIVAVAEGSYVEDVSISKAVRLWGRCPERVEIVGTGAALAALSLYGPANALEVHDLAVRGAAVAVSGTNALLERVWIHDSPFRGVILQNDFGPTSASMRGSLIESVRDISIFVGASTFDLAASVVRETLPSGVDQSLGRGLEVQSHPATGERSMVTVTGSLFEQNRDRALFLSGSDMTVATTVVRDTEARASDQQVGAGIWIEGLQATGQLAALTLRDSIVERSRQTALFVWGSSATIDSSVLRGTLSQASDLMFGFGIGVEDQFGTPSNMTLTSSVVEGNRQVGVHVGASSAHIESTIVRNTLPDDIAGEFGRGINVQVRQDTGLRASASILASLVEGNHEQGIIAKGADVDIEATIVRRTQPAAASMEFGRGIELGVDPMSTQRTNARVHRCLVEDNLDVGIFVAEADAVIEATVIRNTAARSADGLFGDGVVVRLSGPAQSSHALLDGSIIHGSARAGVAVFGADAEVRGTALACNLIHLDGESFLGGDFALADLGGNACSCEEPTSCKVLSTSLEPPAPVEKTPGVNPP